MIYGLGLLDCGHEETWNLLEEMLIENFQNLKKIDFDNALAGFCTGSLKKGSTKLMRIFVMCTMQNYGSITNMQHEDFILAASYIAKDRDKISSDKIDLRDFWAMTLNILMDYIALPNQEQREQGSQKKSRKNTSPSLATLCLKLVSKNNATEMT